MSLDSLKAMLLPLMEPDKLGLVRHIAASASERLSARSQAPAQVSLVLYDLMSGQAGSRRVPVQRTTLHDLVEGYDVRTLGREDSEPFPDFSVSGYDNFSRNHLLVFLHEGQVFVMDHGSKGNGSKHGSFVYPHSFPESAVPLPQGQLSLWTPGTTIGLCKPGEDGRYKHTLKYEFMSTSFDDTSTPARDDRSFYPSSRDILFE